MLLVISLISFLAINLAPNSFIDAGGLNPNMTPEVIENLKKIYGLDKPIMTQYFVWLQSLLSLDFGVSFASGVEVKEEILRRLPITLILNIVSMVFIFFVSFYLGVIAALKSDTKSDTFIKNLSLFSFAMPSFYLSLILIYVFAYLLKIFPISGLHSIDVQSGWSYYLDMAWHLFLPIFIIFIGGLGSLTIYVRSLTNDILKSDYIFYAKARGLSQKVIVSRYILPNLKPPVITLLGLSLPGIIGGSVILESIFAIDGMGLLFFQSALSHDYPVIMGILIIGAFLTLLGNIIADLILLKVNPFVK